jgi:hypothetical protein
MSISQTVPDLTGNIQSVGMQRQPGVKHFEAQSAQAINAAYYFDLAARDYILAAGAIQLVSEGAPRSAFIQSSQSSELTFCGRFYRLRGTKHAGDGGKSRRGLQDIRAAR